jgi:uncharacterized OB-fold protein
MNARNKDAFQCTKCGRVTYPKRAVCLGCGNREFKVIPFSKECTLLTFTVIYQLPWGINDRFLTIGVCKFDNGVKAMGRITSPDVKMGQRLKAEYKKFRQMAGEDIYGWEFSPA